MKHDRLLRASIRRLRLALQPDAEAPGPRWSVPGKTRICQHAAADLHILFLKRGAERPYTDFFKIGVDDKITEICSAAREAQDLLASRLSAQDYFLGAQSRGLTAAPINPPAQTLRDPHFVERGFPAEVEHPELGRSFTYPGAPYRFARTRWQIQRRAPRIGEHNEEILGELVPTQTLRALRSEGVL